MSKEGSLVLLCPCFVKFVNDDDEPLEE